MRRSASTDPPPPSFRFSPLAPQCPPRPIRLACLAGLPTPHLDRYPFAYVWLQFAHTRAATPNTGEADAEGRDSAETGRRCGRGGAAARMPAPKSQRADPTSPGSQCAPWQVRQFDALHSCSWGALPTGRRAVLEGALRAPPPACGRRPQPPCASDRHHFRTSCNLAFCQGVPPASLASVSHRSQPDPRSFQHRSLQQCRSSRAVSVPTTSSRRSSAARLDVSEPRRHRRRRRRPHRSPRPEAVGRRALPALHKPSHRTERSAHQSPCLIVYLPNPMALLYMQGPTSLVT